MSPRAMTAIGYIGALLAGLLAVSSVWHEQAYVGLVFAAFGGAFAARARDFSFRMRELAAEAGERRGERE